MAAAKILWVTVLISVYLASCILLLADSLPLGWALLFITFHILYSWGMVWLYAYLKVCNHLCWAGLLIPVLTTTSTLGIVIWMLFCPEARLRTWLDRASARKVN